MILTKEEREKFANYLLENANSDSLLAEQLANMPGPSAEIAKRYRAEAMAAKIIATKLLSTETG